jgi:hypothetical protein
MGRSWQLAEILNSPGKLMIRNLLLGILAVGTLAVPGYCDNEIADQVAVKVKEKQARTVSKQFVKAFFKHRDLEDVMDLVAVPHGYDWGDLSNVIGTLDELKEVYEIAVEKEQRFRPDREKWSFELLEARTYEEYLAKEGQNIQPAKRKLYDAIMKKTDWLVHVRMKYKGRDDANLWVWVGSRDGDARVVGWYRVVEDGG